MEHDPNKYHKLHLDLQVISCQYRHHEGLLDFAEMSSGQIIYIHTLTSPWGLCFLVGSGFALRATKQLTSCLLLHDKSSVQVEDPNMWPLHWL